MGSTYRDSRCDVCGIHSQLETHPCGARVCPGCWDRCTADMADDAWDRWALREAWAERPHDEEL